METFLEGVEKIRAHVDNLKRQEESSFKISPYRKDLLRGPIMAFKSQLECCICMDMSKRGGGIFSCQSDHLVITQLMYSDYLSTRLVLVLSQCKTTSAYEANLI